MKIRSIALDDAEGVSSATVELSFAELLFIAKFSGDLSDAQGNEILPGGSEISSEVYASLAHGLFNRFYDDGVSEAVRDYVRR